MAAVRKAALMRGMRDDRWTNRDKINQINGLISLKNRDVKQAAFNVDILRKSQSDEIKNLKRDVSKLLSEYKSLRQGNAQAMRNILRENREAQIALKDKPVSAAMEYLEQSNFVKCKDLNSLRCKKIKLMRELLSLQLEETRLKSKLQDRQSEKPDVKQEQTLTNLIFRVTMKQDAAASVNFTYTNILNVLHKDANFFNPVLEILNQELLEQCKAVLKVTGKGQEVTEAAADIREECRRFEEKLKMMMHDRSEAVNNMRIKVEKNRNACRALLPTDTISAMDAPARKQQLEVLDTQELQKMEKIMQQLRNATLVQETDDIYPRLKEQIVIGERLKRIMNQKTKRRDSWLKKRNHAELSKDNIEHNMEEFTLLYKKHKSSLLKEIEEKRTDQHNKEIEMEKLGRAMISMRAALFSVAAILDHVKIPEQLSFESAPAKYQWDPMDDWTDKLYARSFELGRKCPPNNAMKLLQKIYFKSWLLTQQLSTSKDFRISHRFTYQFIPKVTLEERGKGDQADEQLSSSILDADDDSDPTVPTRAELKARSKKIVDYYIKLPEMKPEKPRKKRPDETKYWCPRATDAD